MKKTLVICSIYPLPEMYGGGIRTMNFVRFFKSLGTVDLLCRSQPPQVRAPGVFRKEWFIPDSYFSGGEKRGNLNTRVHRLVHQSPWIVDDVSLDGKTKFLSILYSEDYDFILVRYLFNTAHIFDLRRDYRKRVVIDYDDILSGSLFGAYHGGASSLYSKLRLRLERKILINYEQKCLKLGAALFCSEEDRKWIAGSKRITNAHVVPNIYENRSFDEFDFGENYGNLGSILFLGTIDYKPNLEGLMWFLEEIYPCLRVKFPGTEFSIVGRSSFARDFFSRFPGVHFYPNVPDVKPFYRDCGLVVVPLLSGGGTRIKILEAGLANRPVLTTPVGAEGLSVVEGRDALFFSGPESFVSQYSKLLQKDVYHSLVRHLRRLVVLDYSRARFDKAMEDVVASLQVE